MLGMTRMLDGSLGCTDKMHVKLLSGNSVWYQMHYWVMLLCCYQMWLTSANKLLPAQVLTESQHGASSTAMTSLESIIKRARSDTAQVLRV